MNAKPLRILFLCQNNVSAPTEKQALAFAERLGARGHQILFWYGNEPEAVEREQLGDIPGVELHHYAFGLRHLRREDLELARDWAPDAIHAFNSRVFTAAAARDLVHATAAPLFVHFEDDEWSPLPQGFPGERRYLPAARFARRRLSALHPPLWWQSTPWSLGLVARHARAFDALTPVLSREVSRRFGGRPCQTILPISMARDDDRAPGDQHLFPRPPRGEFVVLYTGSVLPVYLPDLRLGLAAVAALQRRGRDVSFLHAGAPFDFDLGRLADEAGLAPGTFRALGYRPYRKMPALLAGADVLVQPGPPSDFNRLRLPSKLQDYLASGVPTVTFAVGFGELLADREEALKTHTDRPEELADRIEEILADDALRARLSSGGPAAAARLFDPEANTDALEAHYRARLPDHALSLDPPFDW